MATSSKEIVVTLRLEDKGALQRLGQLEIETKAYQKELRLLNAEIAKNGQATAKQAEQVGILNASIRRNQTVIRELKNDLSGATDAGLRFRDKMAEASRAGLGAFGLQALSVATVTTAVIAAVKELARMAEVIELVDARNKAIAGDSLPALTKAAEANAEALGLTRRQYVSLAADQELRLKNLGIEGDLVTDLALETVKQAEALSDFSGGQLDTEQAAKLLNDALTGQTRGLKELGINVKASKEEIAAQAIELQKSKGLTEEQATAVATLQLAFKATEETMAVFGDQTLRIDEAQDKATARINEAKEALAEGLQPALARTSETAADLLDVLSRFAQINFGGPEGLANVIQQISDDANKAFKKGIDQFLETATDAQIRAAQLEVAKQAARVASVAKGDAVLEAEVRRLSDIYDQLGAGIGNATTAQGAFSAEAKKAPATLKTLNAELKALKDARETLDVTDTAGLAANAAQITALEKQIAALDTTTKKTKELTAAQKKAADQAKELAAAEALITGGKNILNKPQQDQGNSLLPADNQPALDAAKAAAIEYQNIQEQLRIQEIQGITDFNTQLAALDAEFYADKTLSLEEYEARKQEIIDKSKEAELENTRLQVQAAADFFGALSQLAEQGTAEFKALATTQALINTYLGATQVLTDVTLPTFAKILGVAAVIASGLASVAKIQGFAKGGRITGGFPIQRDNGDDVLITAKKDEVIMNEPQQRKAKRLYGDDFFQKLGIPGFIGGGAVRRSNYTFTKSTGLAPLPSPRDILNIEAAAEQRAMEFNPVVSVVEMLRVMNRVRTIENLATA